jgi:hypothetical protein
MYTELYQQSRQNHKDSVYTENFVDFVSPVSHAGKQGTQFMIWGGIMRLDYKLAIVMSGRYQFEIARECGLSEGRLSRFLRGRERLRPEEEQRLRTVLGVVAEGEEVQSNDVEGELAGAK